MLWVAGLTWLVIALRRQLRLAEAERDRYAGQAQQIAGLIGRQMEVVAGEKKGQRGTALWIYGDEICLQTGADRLTVKLADVAPAVAPALNEEKPAGEPSGLKAE